jgi:iron(III) transport system permease protein
VLRRHQEAAITGLAALVLVGAALVPLLLVVLEVGGVPPGPEPHWELRALRWLGVVGPLLLQSIALAATVTMVALVVGVPLGLVLARFDLPGRRALLALHAVPMFLPPFVLALGWYHLFGQSGLFGSEATVRVLFGPVGVIGVLLCALTPVVTVLVALGLDGVDPALEETARLVAPPWLVATRILLPLAWPAAALAALIVFTLAFSELGVPMFLRVKVYPAAVFSRLGGIVYAPGEALVLALPLLGVAIALLAMERRITRRQGVTVLGSPVAASALPAGRWRIPLLGLATLVVAGGALPLAALCGRAARGGFAAMSTWVGGTVWTSLVSSVLAATVITTVGLVLGHAVARRRPGGSLIDVVAVLAFVTPAALLGVGLIALWNRPATQLVYGTLAIVVIAWVARYAVIGVRVVAISVAQGAPHHEEAAAALGGSFLRRLLRIVLAEHRRAVAGAWLLALVFCLRDLETAIFLYPPGREPLLVRIFTLEANGPESVVAALAVLHVAITLCLLAIGGAWISRRVPA